MSPLPHPFPGKVDMLRPFVNVGGDDEWRLLVVFLVQALLPWGPYPVLQVHGEQGSAKSTLVRAVVGLIDPKRALLRSQPKDEHDLPCGSFSHRQTTVVWVPKPAR